ncbi:hypothetical protein C8D87_104406 [Lentzea atacamensis]|uniref:Uncharacterized protein n=1 Tax=Lentzea atacamensis TaxID=531938 RepID=A0ABX9E832_9PSEU|nr:hypothetical protein C8D87_104406 [Lentzea atacamensis]
MRGRVDADEIGELVDQQHPTSAAQSGRPGSPSGEGVGQLSGVSAARCWRCNSPITLPSAMSNAVNRLVMPLRT